MEKQLLTSEIAQLENKLEQKKKELAGASAEQPERNIFRQVVREHASPESPKLINYSTATATNPTTQKIQPLTQSEEQDVQTLIQYAFSKGIEAAVNEAKKKHSPYFVDLLHDYLADEYYEKLIAARKINPK